MGADWSSNSIIGVRIRNPRVQTKSRGCRHTESAARFCAECGKPMWEVSTELSPKLDALESCDNKTGLQVCYSTDNEEYFVGMYLAATSSNRSGDYTAKTDLPPLINTAEVKAKLMEYLGDLYNEREFGLWTVLHCSY